MMCQSGPVMSWQQSGERIPMPWWFTQLVSLASPIQGMALKVEQMIQGVQ